MATRRYRKAGGSDVKLVIADDEAMVRGGLRMLIESEPDLEVVGEAADGHEAIEITRRVRPDLVLMDFPCRGSTG